MGLVERYMNAKVCSHTMPMVTMYFVVLLSDNLHRRNVRPGRLQNCWCLDECRKSVVHSMVANGQKLSNGTMVVSKLRHKKRSVSF